MTRLNRRAFLATASAATGLAAAGAQAQAGPVRVGVLTDMTGLYADAIGPGSFLAARMAAEDAGGTLLGRKIEVLSADNQNKADIGSAIARQWYDRDQVGMIVGMDNSSVALAVEQVARERNGRRMSCWKFCGVARWARTRQLVLYHRGLRVWRGLAAGCFGRGRGRGRQGSGIGSPSP